MEFAVEEVFLLVKGLYHVARPTMYRVYHVKGAKVVILMLSRYK